MRIKKILFGVKFPSENVCAQQKAVYIVSNDNDVEMLIKNILFGVKFPSENVCAQQKAVYIVSNDNDVEEHIPLSFHRY